MKLKRALMIALVLSLTLCAFFVTASAATVVDSGKCGDNVTWTFDSEGTLTVSGTGEMADCVDIVYDEHWSEDWVYCAPWDEHQENINKIIIKEGVTSISWGAFYEAYNVTEIYLPSTLSYIGPEAFHNTQDVTVHITDLRSFLNIDMDIYLSGWGARWMTPENSPMNHASLVLNGMPVTTLVIPEGITSIPAGLFYGSRGINTVYFPETLQTVWEHAFDNSSVSSVYFVGDHIDFYNYAFGGSLENVYVDSLENWLTYTFDITYSPGGDGDGSESSQTTNPLYHCENFYVNGKRVTDLHIPSGTTHIERGAFIGYTGLQCLRIPASVKKIGGAAFMNCTGISEIFFAGSAPEGGISGTVCTSFCDSENCSECETWYAFSNVTATAYYPANNSTWTSNARKSYGGQITWKANMPIAITTQPQTTYTKYGETAAVTVKATGDGLTYQWYYRNADETVYSKSSNQKDTYLPIMNEVSKDRRVYCVITDKYGNQVQTKTVILRMAASVIAEPKTTYTKYGNTASVTVAAVGDELSYQWYYRNADETVYSKSSNQKDTYKPVMNETSKDRRVYCVITDKYGNQAQTKTVVLRMAASIVTQPKSIAVANGKTAKVTLKAMGDGLTYKWYYKNAGATKFSLTTSFTSNSYSVAMNEARDGRQVYCVVKDKYGKTVQSNTVTLNMSKPLTIITQPKTTYTKLGATAKVTVKAEGDGLTYQWYIRNANASTYSKSSITDATYSVKMSSSVKDRRVYCVVKDQYGNTVQTKTVLLRMAASITSQPINASAAKGKTVSVSVGAAGDGLTYTWYIKNASGTKFSVSSVTGATYSCTMSATSNGRQIYCVVTDKYGNTVKTDTVTLKMK